MPGRLRFINTEEWSREECMEHLRRDVIAYGGIWNPDDVWIGESHYGYEKYFVDFTKEDD